MNLVFSLELPLLTARIGEGGKRSKGGEEQQH
jgi:hypothetical protein